MQKSPLQYSEIHFQYWNMNLWSCYFYCFGVHLISPCFAFFFSYLHNFNFYIKLAKAKKKQTKTTIKSNRFDFNEKYEEL